MKKNSLCVFVSGSKVSILSIHTALLIEMLTNQIQGSINSALRDILLGIQDFQFSFLH